MSVSVVHGNGGRADFEVSFEFFESVSNGSLELWVGNLRDVGEEFVPEIIRGFWGCIDEGGEVLGCFFVREGLDIADFWAKAGVIVA